MTNLIPSNSTNWAVEDDVGANTNPHLYLGLICDWLDLCDITVACVDISREAVRVWPTEGGAAVCLCFLWRWSLFSSTCRWVQTGKHPTRRHQRSSERSFGVMEFCNCLFITSEESSLAFVMWLYCDDLEQNYWTLKFEIIFRIWIKTRQRSRQTDTRIFNTSLQQNSDHEGKFVNSYTFLSFSICVSSACWRLHWGSLTSWWQHMRIN